MYDGGCFSPLGVISSQIVLVPVMEPTCTYNNPVQVRLQYDLNFYFSLNFLTIKWAGKVCTKLLRSLLNSLVKITVKSNVLNPLLL